ncbi:MAG: hypothetical protein JWO56_3224, partial [Acidobacteria bacterium]|nr:hypothetical protein [Acidobacteriota bacterium]
MGTVTAGEEGALFNYHIMRLRLRQAAYESGLFVAY